MTSLLTKDRLLTLGAGVALGVLATQAGWLGATTYYKTPKHIKRASLAGGSAGMLLVGAPLIYLFFRRPDLFRIGGGDGT